MYSPLFYPFGGLGLARYLELAEAKDAVEFAGVWMERHPDNPAAVCEIAGGQAVFAGIGSPLSHAVGIGMNGAVSEADFDRLEQFYLVRGSPPIIDLCPFADHSLNELLGKRHYRITEFNNVLVRPLAADHVYVNDAVTQSGDEPVWARTVSIGFMEREEITPEELEFAGVFFGMPTGTPWIAHAGDEPAAAASMAIQDKLALLFGDSTIPRFRKQGLHSALIQARMAYAAAQGCDLATASTIPGSGSQANYERLGFRLVYMKMIMSRD